MVSEFGADVTAEEAAEEATRELEDMEAAALVAHFDSDEHGHTLTLRVLSGLPGRTVPRWEGVSVSASYRYFLYNRLHPEREPELVGLHYFYWNSLTEPVLGPSEISREEALAYIARARKDYGSLIIRSDDEQRRSAEARERLRGFLDQESAQLLRVSEGGRPSEPRRRRPTRS